MNARLVRACRAPAQSPGTCAICREPYREGEQVFLIGDRMVHVRCPPLHREGGSVIPLRRARSS
jgi:hypothetical protein